MSFDPVEELKVLVSKIEGKLPVDLLDFFDEMVDFYKENGIVENMHIGKDGDWNNKEIAEWLLSMFIGSVKKGKENNIYYGSLNTILNYSYHYIFNKEK